MEEAMPRKRLSMRKITEVLRLKYDCGATNREIAGACSMGVATVHEYLTRAKCAQIAWPLPPDLTEQEIEKRLFPKDPALSPSARPTPQWSHVRTELRRKGVTLRLLWEEYRADHPNGYSYSRFQEIFRAWEATAFPRMPQTHLPGDKLFVDYAGQTMDVIDRATGEIRQAQIFVATLGASNYTYAEATWTQAIPDWIASHVRALEFLGGVPRAIVPDNLKSGVKSANFYEPDINPTYYRLALHYGVAILPTRVRKPKDKAKVENGVLQVERRILAALRNRSFFSLAELNVAIRELLIALNERPSQTLPDTRKALFEAIDKPVLSPLPDQPFECEEWRVARVNLDYHIDIGRHYYSVPHGLLGKSLDVRITRNTVEVLYKNERVASHPRSSVKFAHSTLQEHMPAAHQYQKSLSHQRLITWAARIGPAAVQMAEKIIASRPHPEQGFRACQGILRLADRYGCQRVEAACAQAIEQELYGYRRVAALVTESAQPDTKATKPLHHANIRGADYFQA
jgi:transposase